MGYKTVEKKRLCGDLLSATAPPVRHNQKARLATGFVTICIYYILDGGQGQNRTADTGIFRASKINKLLSILAQTAFGTVSENNVDSTG